MAVADNVRFGGFGALSFSTMPPPLHRTTSMLRQAPQRAAKSFDNLVALANDQERLAQAARKLVWRDRGQPVVELPDLQKCLEHAAAGGLRAGSLAFGIRSGINVFLLLFRVFKTPKELRFAMVRHAVLGLDSYRFGAMIGSYVALYKFILNALPLVVTTLSPSVPASTPTTPPSPARPRSLPDIHIAPFQPITRASHVCATPTDVESGFAVTHEYSGVNTPGALSATAMRHEVWVRKRGRKHHAFLAGFVAGGIAIFFERRDRRVAIAQQLFVRGLQGSYNALSETRNIRIPHGDVMIFVLACAQIMFSFTMRPDTIPRSYNTWIHKAARTIPESVHINMDLTRDYSFDVEDVNTVLGSKNVTDRNRTLILEFLRLAETDPCSKPHYAPCAIIHPWLDSCAVVQIERFYEVFKWMMPIYGALHLIPTVLFKWQVFRKQPAPLLQSTFFDTIRSSVFLGVFVIIYQGYMCLKVNCFEFLSSPKRRSFWVPAWLLNALISRGSFWIGGGFSGLSLFIEAKRRRAELAMYVLPKALESVWTAGLGKLGMRRVFHGSEGLFCAIAMGMVMSTYQNDPQHLSGFVRRIVYQFVGPN